MLTLTGSWLWLGSSAGLTWLSQQISAQSHNQFQVSNLKGHLFSKVSGERLFIHQPNLEVTVADFSVEWQPVQLLLGKVSILSLQAKAIDIKQQPATPSEPKSPESTPFQPPALAIQLQSLSIDKLTMTEAEKQTLQVQNITGENLLFSSRFGGALTGQMRADVLHPKAQGHIDAQLRGRLQTWNLDLNFKQSASEYGSIKLSGNLLNQGLLEAEVFLNETQTSITSHWKQNDATLTANGEATLNHQGFLTTGTWDAAVDLKDFTTKLQMQSSTQHQTLFNRPLKLVSTLNWANNTLDMQSASPNQDISISLFHNDTALESKLRFARWSSPFSQAEGQLSGEIAAQLEYATQAWKINGLIEKGEIAGVPLSLKLNSQGKSNVWQIQTLQVQALDFICKVSGSGTEEHINLRANLESKNIGTALTVAQIPNTKGAFKADIVAQGKALSPTIKLEVQGSNLGLEQISIKSLHLSTAYQPEKGTYNIEAHDISNVNNIIAQQLKVTGKLLGEVLSGSLRSSGDIQSQLSFDYSPVKSQAISPQTNHIFNLYSPKVSYQDTNVFQADSMRAMWNPSTIQIQQAKHLKILNRDAKLKFNMENDVLNGLLHLSSFPITSLSTWFKSFPYDIAGNIDTTLSLNGTLLTPIADLQLNSPSLAIKHTLSSHEDTPTLNLSKVKIGMRYENNHLLWTEAADTQEQGRIESHADIALFWQLKPWLFDLPTDQGTGDMSIIFAKLSDFQSLFPRIDPLEGSGSIAFDFSLPFSVQSVHADAGITFSSIGFPELGLDMNGEFKTTLKDGVPQVHLVLHNGEGKLSMVGPLDMELRRIPDIHFENFHLMKLPKQQLSLHGRISASETKKISVIEGSLDVPILKFEIPDASPLITEDLVWKDLGAPKQNSAKPAPSRMHIILNINGQSEVYGRGMSMKPKGKLLLEGSFEQPQLTGALEIESGKIDYRSVKLDILPESRVLFTGNPKLPTIYIRAARKVGQLLAGVIVQGPINNLSSQLFSEPSMSNAEIFSYIATGRALNKLGKENASDLLTASEFIFGSGTVMSEIQNTIQNVTGLDIFVVDANVSGGKVQVGRKLAPDLMITVDQAVSKDTTTALTLEYMLSRSVSVFARQTTNLSPKVGTRFSKEWFNTPSK